MQPRVGRPRHESSILAQTDICSAQSHQPLKQVLRIPAGLLRRRDARDVAGDVREGASSSSPAFRRIVGRRLRRRTDGGRYEGVENEPDGKSTVPMRGTYWSKKMRATSSRREPTPVLLKIDFR